LVLIVSRAADDTVSVLVAYTTSRPWRRGERLPPGVFVVEREEAVTMGQARSFVVDARRLAFVTLSERWFPSLGQPEKGVLGRAPNAFRQRIEASATELLTRRPESVERLGASWPRQGRT
jgi:hypothetical protein